jgi:hypothetical protein
MATRDQIGPDAGAQKYPETKAEQPSKRSHQGTDHRGHEQDDNAGAKDHRRRVDAGEARKNAR